MQPANVVNGSLRQLWTDWVFTAAATLGIIVPPEQSSKVEYLGVA